MSVLNPQSSSSSDSSTDDENNQRNRRNKRNNHRHISSGQCPACKRILQIGDIFPAPYVDQKINSQIIRCVYFHKGCVWTGTVNELKRSHNGHLKQCGYTLYTCKYCKEKIERNQMVRHQNDECKSQYMVCPYYIYGCAFECRIREMEKHCKLNELKHVKLKLDYLENQLFVPEIIKLKGMTGYNNEYIESNGKYYLINKDQKRKNKKQYNKYELKPITYKKNGGYTLEFNQNECIWHLRSLYYGLIAYGMARHIKHNNVNNKEIKNKQLNYYMNENCVWSVYFKPNEKNSLMIDKKVRLQSIQLSDGMMKWNVNDNETDTEEINGEFDVNMHIQNQNNNYENEGFVNQNNHNNLHKIHHQSWYNIIFGAGAKINNIKRKKLTAKRLEVIGIIALTGIAVYYLWSKFGRSHPIPAVAVLQTKTGILIPKSFLG